MFVIVWREVGFGIVLFLARLLTLPEEQFEAARIDGAGWWARLRYVILPELQGHDRVLRGGRGDHDARLGVRLRLDADRRAGPGDATQRARALHLQPGPPELAAGHGVGGGGAADGRDDALRRALFYAGARRARRRSRDGVRRAGRTSDRRLRPAAPVEAPHPRAASSGSSCSSGAAILALYPVWFMVSTAFKSNATSTSTTSSASPGRSTIGNFGEALRGGEFFTLAREQRHLRFGSRDPRDRCSRRSRRSRSRA